MNRHRKKRSLTLNLKREYYEAIRDGLKTSEYRLQTEYWKKRLEGRVYENIIICLGYPVSGDLTRRIIFPYKGILKTTITHKHFGKYPVDVYEILLRERHVL